MQETICRWDRGQQNRSWCFWPCDESKWYGKGYDAGIRRGKKKQVKRWMEEISACF